MTYAVMHTFSKVPFHDLSRLWITFAAFSLRQPQGDFALGICVRHQGIYTTSQGRRPPAGFFFARLIKIAKPVKKERQKPAAPEGEAGRMASKFFSSDYFIVGMTNSAPSLRPDGQREVTVFVRV